MAADWQNVCLPLDVSNDGVVTPIDALLPINRINRFGSGALPKLANGEAPPHYYDTDGNGYLVPLDVLFVVNALNNSTAKDVFTFEGELVRDTAAGGATNSDELTSNPRLKGHITSVLGMSSFKAQVDGGAVFDVPSNCGSFQFDPGLPLDGSADGPHQVQFTSVDPYGRQGVFDVSFTLDTLPPPLSLEIASEDDTGVVEDWVTTKSIVTLAGITEPGSTVLVAGMSESVVADVMGSFRVPGISLEPGANVFSVVATDLAGNQSSMTETFTRAPCDFQDLTEGLIAESSLPMAGDPIPQVGWGDVLDRAAGNGYVGIASALLDNNHFPDLVTVSRATNEVLVYLGKHGLIGSPVRYDSGASEPVTVSVANFVDDGSPDIAVGHLDGTVTFLRGLGDGTFYLDNAATVTGLGTISDISARDFDHDGDSDLAVSSGGQVTLLVADDDLLVTSPIVNGDFSQALAGWSATSVGQSAHELPGHISANGSVARIFENNSLLTSLSQTFTVPPNPQQLSLQILDLHFDAANGGIPDALDISLLDSQSQPLLNPFAAGATAFFNITPGQPAGMSGGVAWDGITVTADISQLTPGTSATLFIDLIGNRPGSGSVVTIDNVHIVPDAIYRDSFTAQPLTGPFVNATEVRYCQYNDAHRHELIVKDTGLGGYVIFESDGNGGLTRVDEIFGGGNPGGEGEADNRHIQIGEVISLSIDATDEVDTFTFDATSGQRLFFDNQSQVSLLSWRVDDPAGNRLFDSLIADQGVIELSSSGTYTLQIDSGPYDSTGTYQFQIYDVPPASTLSIGLGEVVTGHIQTPGEQYQFVFEAVEGHDLFFYAISGIGTVRWQLTSPSSGVLFDENYNDQGPMTLTESGTYQLLISGKEDRTGDYQFQINDVTLLDPVSIALNEFVFGRIDVASERDRYAFSGRAGDQVFFDALSGSGAILKYQIDNPDGTPLIDSNYGDAGPIELQQDGEYVMTMSARGDSILSYDFVVWDVPPDVPQPIPYETPIPGAVVIPGQSHSYQFDGVSGNPIFFDEIDPGASSRYTLVAPTGLEVFSAINADRIVTSLPETGTYTLTVRALNDDIGPYSFQIVHGTQTLPIGPAPNLELTDVSAPLRIISPQASLTLGWVITNSGTAAVLAGTTLTDRIYLSDDVSLDDFAKDHLLAESRITLLADLNPGESLNRSEQVVLPAGLEAELQLLVYTDAYNTVFEGRNKEADNNVHGTLIAVYPQERDLGGAPEVALDIDDGASFPAGTPFTLSGQTSVKPGALNAIFLVDISGSTELETDHDANFDGVVDDQDDLNADNRRGDLLDAQIGMVLETATRLQAQTDDLRVSVIAWGGQNVTSPEDAEPLDLGAEFLNQTFHFVSSDSNDNGIRDFEESVRSMEYVKLGSLSHTKTSLFRRILLNSGNDFQAAVEELQAVLKRAPDADQTQVYFFMDGIQIPSTSADESLLEEVAAQGIDFRVGQFTGTVVHPELQRMADIIGAHPNSTASAVIADTPDKFDDISASSQPVAGVTVNGFGVESFDQAGNFFTTITLQPGMNTFDIAAISAGGEVASKRITLVGEDATDPTFDDLDDVTSSTTVSFSGTTFNRLGGNMLARAVVTNNGDVPLRGPVRVVFERFDPGTVELVSPNMLDPLGRPVIEFDVELGPNGLLPGETSAALPIELANLPRDRFDFQVSVFALGNTSPKFSSVPQNSAQPSTAYQYSSMATDAEHDRLTYGLSLAPDGMSLDPNSGVVNWTPSASQLGMHMVVLIAQDGYGGKATQTFNVNVEQSPPNQPPRFVSAPITQVDSGRDYAYQALASDLDGDAVQFSLLSAPVGMTIDASAGLVSLASAADGDYAVEILVEDGNGGQAVQAYVLTIGNVATNPSAPLILSKPATLAAVDAPYLYLPLAQDADGDVLRFSLVAAPSGMTIHPDSGRIDWTPDAIQLGPHPVVLRVDDDRGGYATQLYSIDVQMDPNNLPPVFTSVPALLGTQGVEYIYDANALDGDNDPLTYQLDQGPVGMVLETTTGVITFTANQAQLGTHRIRLQARDALGSAAVQTFDLEVRPPNTPPTFTSSPITNVTAGTTYRYDADALDAEDGVRFSLAFGPTAMEINAVSGMVMLKSATADVGNHVVTIRATDDRGAFKDQSFTLAIAPDALAPTVSIQFSSAIVLPGEQVTIQVKASDNVKVESKALAIGTTQLTLDSADLHLYDTTVPGLFELTATATDSSGNVGTVTRKLRVLDPNDVTPPDVVVTAPVPGDTITYLADVVGSVTADDLEFYRVEYARSDLIDHADIAADNPAWIRLIESSNTVSNDVLAEFDPTVLQDDSYLIRIYAQDISGNISVLALPIGVEAPAKLGQYSLDFTDLSLPLVGIPIEVTRSYSTLDSASESDFGFGWSLGVAQADLRETVPPGLQSQVGFLGATPFVYGTRVYINDPDGRRVGFTFEPEITRSFFGTAFKPKFTPDPGVYDKLEVEQLTLGQRDDGSFEAFLIGFPYNPDSYRLVRQDGTVYDYHQSRGLETITDRNGNEIHFTDDGIQHSSGQSIQFVRDSLGRITSLIDPDGNAITYDYDARGNLIRVTNQMGLTTGFTYLSDRDHYLDNVFDPLGRQFSKTEYDEQGRVIASIDAAGNRSEQHWDPNNFSGSIVDGNGNVTKLIYNERGNVLEETDPLGGKIAYAYDDPQNPDLETQVTDPLGYTSSFTYDSRGNMLSETDPLGQVTAFTYDHQGNVSSITDSLGGQTTATVDEFGRTTSVTSTDGQTWEYGYDSLGRLTRQVSPHGDISQLIYEAASSMPRQVISSNGDTRSYETNAFGAVTQEIDQDGNVTDYSYDKMGRLVRRKDSLGGEETITYAAHLPIVVQDAQGNSRSFVYDDTDRVISEINAADGITYFSYDAAGNRTSVTDPLGNRTSYTYDALNHLTARTDPLGHITTFQYDTFSNLIERDDRNGKRTEYVYDPIGRVIRETWHDAGAVANEITRSYDSIGNMLTTSDFFSSLAYTYDTLNRIIAIDNLGTPGVPHTVFQQTYDSLGRRGSVSDGDVTVASAYDSLNRLISRTWTGNTIDDARVNIDNAANGDRKYRRFADANASQLVGSSSFESDAKGRTTSIRHLDALDQVLANYDYSYDASDLLIEESHHNQTISYEYDRLGQLLASRSPSLPDETFAYDSGGNRSGQGIVTGANNQLTADATFDYEYDAEGNLIRKTDRVTGEVADFTYDHRNRLTRFVRRSSGSVLLEDVSFTYDLVNRRIIKSSSAGALITVYNGLAPWVDYDAGGNVVARYLTGDLTDQVLARYRPGEGTVWYLADRMGTNRDLAGSDGQVIAHVDFDSFGSIVGTVDKQTVDRFLFTGREFDAETGLYYYRARYYDPLNGRFISQDPIGFTAGDANLYRYVGNSPINFVDPSGLSAADSYGKQAAGTSIWRQALCNALGAAAGVGVGIAHAVTGLYTSITPLTQELAQFGVEAACLRIPSIRLPRLGRTPGGPVGSPSPRPRTPPPADPPSPPAMDTLPEFWQNIIKAQTDSIRKRIRKIRGLQSDVKRLESEVERLDSQLEVLQDAYDRLLEIAAKNGINVWDD